MIMNEEQKEFVKMIHDFCEKEIKPNVAQWDRDGYFPLEEVYNKLFEMGIHLLDIPEENGGLGFDKTTSALIFEELGKYCSFHWSMRTWLQASAGSRYT